MCVDVPALRWHAPKEIVPNRTISSALTHPALRLLCLCSCAGIARSLEQKFPLWLANTRPCARAVMKTQARSCACAYHTIALIFTVSIAPSVGMLSVCALSPVFLQYSVRVCIAVQRNAVRFLPQRGALSSHDQECTHFPV
eukprot:IDg8495t1